MKIFFGNGVLRKVLVYNSSMLLILLMLLVCLVPLSAHAEPYQCDVSGDDRLGLEEAIYLLQSGGS